MCRHEGHGAKHQSTLGGRDAHHPTHPRCAQKLPGEAKRRPQARCGRRHRLGLTSQAAQQQYGGQTKHDRQQDKGPTPAHRIGRKATEPQATHHAQHRGTHQFGQGFLPALIRHLIAHPSHRQRDDAGRGSPHETAHDDQHGQAHRHGRDGTDDRAGRHCQRHHPQFAKTLAQRTIKQLQDTVDHGKHRNHGRGIARADLKLLSQHHQHRVANAHRRHAGKACQAQELQVLALVGRRQSTHAQANCCSRSCKTW